MFYLFYLICFLKQDKQKSKESFEFNIENKMIYLYRII